MVDDSRGFTPVTSWLQLALFPFRTPVSAVVTSNKFSEHFYVLAMKENSRVSFKQNLFEKPLLHYTYDNDQIHYMICI